MHVALAWLASSSGCLVTVQGILRLVYPKTGSYVARKLCHITSGIGFVLTWPLYPNKQLGTALVAASVIGAASGQFLLTGLGVIRDPLLVKGVGHGPGQERKLLEGPLQYGVALTAVTAFWFFKPLAVVTTAVLCSGDGLAALIGKTYGRHALPWNKGKTVEGSFAFVAGSIATSLAMLAYMSVMDPSEAAWLTAETVRFACVAACAGGIAETLPTGTSNLDNLLIPASSMLTAAVLRI